MCFIFSFSTNQVDLDISNYKIHGNIVIDEILTSDEDCLDDMWKIMIEPIIIIIVIPPIFKYPFYDR